MTGNYEYPMPSIKSGGTHGVKMNDHERLLQIIKDMAEEEKKVRGLARQVLTELEVYGDNNGVPTIADVVELLVKKIKKDSK